MRRKCLGVFLASLGVLLVAVPASSHHSVAGAFDVDKPISLVGVITQIRLENPHSWFYVDVTDPNGKVTNWSLEASPPTALIRSGYRRDNIKVGDKVTLKGVHAKDPTANSGAVREITLQNGQSYIVGPLLNAADANR
jgi:hypothetical protein